MDDLYRSFARQYIRRQAKQLAKQLDGIRRADDIEHIHRARVASRRLRAAFRVFSGCFGGRRLRDWRKHVRRLARMLGQARDIDVQIDFLCAFLAQPLEPKCCRGLAWLLAELDDRRGRLQRQVVKAVERLERSRVLPDILAHTRHLSDAAHIAQEGDGLRSARAEFARRIRERLEQFLSLQGSLQHSDDAEQLHAARIAAKRLRYTMEIARAAYFDTLEPFIQAAKTLQTLLGEIHDCDVWQIELESFRAAQAKRMRRVYGSGGPMAQLVPGVELLRQQCVRRRQQLIEELRACWEQLQQQGTWQSLLRLLDECSQPQVPAGLPTQAPLAEAVSPVDSPEVFQPPLDAAATAPAGDSGTQHGEGGDQQHTVASAFEPLLPKASGLGRPTAPHMRRKMTAAASSGE